MMSCVCERTYLRGKASTRWKGKERGEGEGIRGWGVEGGGWRVEDGGWWVVGGGWWVEGGGWRVEDGGWRMENGGWRIGWRMEEVLIQAAGDTNDLGCGRA